MESKLSSMPPMRLNRSRSSTCTPDAGESGQALVEWLGVLVVVAVLIAGAVELGVGSAVAHGVSREVCTIFSSQHCATSTAPTPTTPTPTTPTGTGTYPTSGPPIGSGVGIPILPFNGATVSYCVQPPTHSKGGDPPEGGDDPGDGGEPGDGENPGGDEAGGEGVSGSFSVQACDTISATRGNPTLTALCTETQQLSVSSNLSVKVTAGADKDGTGGSVTVGGGQNVTYQLNVTPGQVAAMKAGTLGQPNPLDPHSLPTNDSIVLNKKTYDELGLSGSYRGVTASLDYQSGHQLSTGIKSLGNGEMQIDVGDSDLVQNALSLGIGNGDLGASVSAGETESEGKLREVDIDTSTPAGWATYQQFLHTGTLPSASAPGASAPATADVFTDSSQVSAAAQAFGLSFGVSSQSNNLTDTQTTHADGSQTNSFSYTQGDVTEVVNTATTRAGRRAQPATSCCCTTSTPSPSATMRRSPAAPTAPAEIRTRSSATHRLS
jgi:hypothetical protein